MVQKKGAGLRNMEKRSQISAFILMGLVILVIFLFMFHIRNTVQRSRATEKIDAVADVLQKTPALNYYVTLCLKDSVESALIIAGKQGGNIYIEQGGLVNRNSVPIFRYNDDNVTYAITGVDTAIPNAIALLGEPSYPVQPQYPCILAISSGSYGCPYDFLLDPVRYYPLGYGHLPMLCMLNGPNDVDTGVYPFPCPSGSYGPSSIQAQIKEYAQIKMQNCTNFSLVRQMVGYNITADPPIITPIMGEDDVIVKATYPINITVDGFGDVRLLDFEVKIPVRMKKIYGLARFLVDYDKAYIDFNMTNDFNSGRYPDSMTHWDPYMRVERFCPGCSLAGADMDTTSIFQINDSASTIMGNDYYFRFAVENRIPALDYMHKTPPEETGYDYIVQEGDEIVMEPLGHDPDDTDDLYYSYELWKETYDEVFDPGCCNEINPFAAVICNDDPWACVIKAPAASLQLCMDDYLQEDKFMWTTSTLHQVPQPGDPSNQYRSANYITKTTDPGQIASRPGAEELNPVYYPCIKDANGDWEGTPYSRDLGPHNVTVKVCDRHGTVEKCDWQSVIIMVTDIPRPVIGIINDYGTTDASLEDPFTLDASRSNIFAAVESYTWKSTLRGSGVPDFNFNVIYSDTQNGRIKVPYPLQTYSIMTIKGANNFFKNEGIHDLSLTIGTQTDTKEITVKGCIPYASANDPYPYNPAGSDPFMANHACCEPDGTYSGTGRKCYNDVEYGSVKYFDSNKYKDETLDIYPIYWYLTSTPTQSAPSPTGEYGNDIFSRTFNRYCSGERGNICTGNAEEVRVLSKGCFDKEYAWQDERCQGPPPGISQTPISACINYQPGYTFENTEGVGAGDGYCSNTPKCTNGIDYSVQGNFLCQRAQCDGNGRCTKPFMDDALKCMCDATCGASPSCTMYSYDDLKNGGLCLPDKTGFCTSACTFQDVDYSMQACMGCTLQWNAGGGAEMGVQGLCCGDDPDENYIRNMNDYTDACCDNKDASGVSLMGQECVLNGVCKDRLATIDICNGIDDDCNPSTADGSGETAPLNTLKQGVCFSSRRSCYGISGWVDDYSYIPDYQAVETSCNDGRDNDCDGWTDCQDDGCPC